MNAAQKSSSIRTYHATPKESSPSRTSSNSHPVTTTTPNTLMRMAHTTGHQNHFLSKVASLHRYPARAKHTIKSRDFSLAPSPPPARFLRCLFIATDGCAAPPRAACVMVRKSTTKQFGPRDFKTTNPRDTTRSSRATSEENLTFPQQHEKKRRKYDAIHNHTANSLFDDHTHTNIQPALTGAIHVQELRQERAFRHYLQKKPRYGETYCTSHTPSLLTCKQSNIPDTHVTMPTRSKRARRAAKKKMET